MIHNIIYTVNSSEICQKERGKLYLLQKVKKYFNHITSVFLLAVFLLNGIGSLLPIFSLDAGKQEIAELLTKTESENSSKEKEEKVPEKELFQHTMDIELPAFIIIDGKKNPPGHSDNWDNIFLAVSTPPPEIA
jgi:hypothetical protein